MFCTIKGIGSSIFGWAFGTYPVAYLRSRAPPYRPPYSSTSRLSKLSRLHKSYFFPEKNEGGGVDENVTTLNR